MVSFTRTLVSINSVESLLDLLLGLDDRVLLFRQRG
jgi:hypothetical protein